MIKSRISIEHIERPPIRAAFLFLHKREKFMNYLQTIQPRNFSHRSCEKTHFGAYATLEIETDPSTDL